MTRPRHWTAYSPPAPAESTILAHELFHAVEEANPDIYTRTEKIELWRKPFSNKTSSSSVGDRGDGVREQLLGLDFNPYALDVLLVYPYDAQLAGCTRKSAI